MALGAGRRGVLEDGGRRDNDGETVRLEYMSILGIVQGLKKG